MDPEHLRLLGRVLLLAAHPDDEAIGAGAQLAEWKDRILILHVTDGAPRTGSDAETAGYKTPADYATARRSELACAMHLAGLGPAQLQQVLIPDQESMLHLARLTMTVAQVIEEFLPDCVLTHPYEGGHPDHDSCAFAARAALSRVVQPPALVEFTSYHAGEQGMIAGSFLGSDAFVSVPLNERQRELKQRMFDCFRTQQHVLKLFPIENEKFRVAPEYDFTRPPHEGRLHYENLNWGIDGARWREHAAQALEQLGINHAVHRA
jgi:LmbE family N-acetylglucosaminyl deacetylase